MQKKNKHTAIGGSGINKYLNRPREYNILGLKVTPRPLKLRWKLLTQSVTARLHRYCIAQSGLTVEESNDPQYTGLLQIYENSFFSLNHKPKNEPAGSDNLAEILKSCADQDIDWNRFITDKLKGKKEDKQLEIYNLIREAGMAMFKDFFVEIIKLKQM